LSEQKLTAQAAAQLPPLTLAFVGDSVFDLYVRTKYALTSNKNAGQLHAMSVKIVNARAQAAFAHSIMDELTEEEKRIFLRGRNAKSATIPKNMSVADYRHATAIEAVIGYLYLCGQEARIRTLFEYLKLEGNR